MKKVLVVVLALVLTLTVSLLTACDGGKKESSSGINPGASLIPPYNSTAAASSASSASASIQLSPPDWLIGEWVTESGDTKIVVTASNVVTSNGALDFADSIKNGLKVYESSGDTSYKMSFVSGSFDCAYTFEQLTDDTITVTISIGSSNAPLTYKRII